MFDQPRDHRPLPERLRPRKWEQFCGQHHIWNNSSPLKKIVEADGAHALLFWGPPGTGKTTLAQLVGLQSQRKYVPISAVHASVKDIRAIVDASQHEIASGGKTHLLFIDEIHRLSKSQQDVLLPALENGDIRFIGATTENPSFSVNNAILSRCMTFTLHALQENDLVIMMKQALESDDPIFVGVKITDEALKLIAQAARGDGRQCLNLLSAVTCCVEPTSDGVKVITQQIVVGLSSHLPIRYDRDGDQHYDIISAFIKSIRASHPDAAVYYLARMIEGGEDPLFIARRLLISASEDIGNANPTALLIAEATFKTVEVLGLPEARISLSQCTTYLASSPKSNRAYQAINTALADVKRTGPLEIPLHLRNAPTSFLKKEGHGAGYAYAHDDLQGARALTYLPKELKGTRYYEPSTTGTERQFIETLKQLRPTQD